MAQDPDEMMEESGEEQPSSSKSKLSVKTLILIGLPLVLVQAVLAYYVVSNYIEPQLPETKPRPEEQQAPAEGEAQAVEDLSTFTPYAVEDVIVNPAETGGQRYVSTNVVFYVPTKYAEMIDELEPEFRAAIIEQISSKRMDEVNDLKDQQILREEIKDDINALIDHYFQQKYPDLNIPRVVFSKFIIQ